MSKLIISLIFISFHVQSQTEEYSNVNLAELFIQNISGGKFPFFGNKAQLIQGLGEPNTIKNVSNADMLDYNVLEDYIYDGLIIRLESRPENILAISFEINKNYMICYKNHLIKIGDSVETLRNIFPTSYNLMKNSDDTFIRIEYDETDKVTPYYSPLFIDFDKESKLITGIGVSIL